MTDRYPGRNSGCRTPLRIWSNASFARCEGWVPGPIRADTELSSGSRFTAVVGQHRRGDDAGGIPSRGTQLVPHLGVREPTSADTSSPDPHSASSGGKPRAVSCLGVYGACARNFSPGRSPQRTLTRCARIRVRWRSHDRVHTRLRAAPTDALAGPRFHGIALMITAPRIEGATLTADVGTTAAVLAGYCCRDYAPLRGASTWMWPHYHVALCDQSRIQSCRTAWSTAASGGRSRAFVPSG